MSLTEYSMWRTDKDQFKSSCTYIHAPSFHFASICSCSLPAKVTQLEDGSFWVDEQVLRLDVSVTHALGMDISQTAKQLVHVHLRRSQHQSNTLLKCKLTKRCITMYECQIGEMFKDDKFQKLAET